MQDLDLAHRPMARVHLDAAVVVARRRREGRRAAMSRVEDVGLNGAEDRPVVGRDVGVDGVRVPLLEDVAELGALPCRARRGADCRPRGARARRRAFASRRASCARRHELAHVLRRRREQVCVDVDPLRELAEHATYAGAIAGTPKTSTRGRQRARRAARLERGHQRVEQVHAMRLGPARDECRQSRPANGGRRRLPSAGSRRADRRGTDRRRPRYVARARSAADPTAPSTYRASAAKRGVGPEVPERLEDAPAEHRRVEDIELRARADHAPEHVPHELGRQDEADVRADPVRAGDREREPARHAEVRHDDRLGTSGVVVERTSSAATSRSASASSRLRLRQPQHASPLPRHQEAHRLRPSSELAPAEAELAATRRAADTPPSARADSDRVGTPGCSRS